MAPLCWNLIGSWGVTVEFNVVSPTCNCTIVINKFMHSQLPKHDTMIHEVAIIRKQTCFAS